MTGLIILSILLVFCVILLVSYILFIKGLTAEKFNEFCNKKIGKISTKNNLKYLDKISLYNFAQEKVKIDSIIFGKKFIYLVTNSFLLGNVEGDKNDNSWIYYNRQSKTQKYIENLLDVGNKNIQEIAGILAINAELLVSIAVTPNECNFNVKNAQEQQNFVTSYLKLSSKISEFESKNVSVLKSEQINDKISVLKKKNEERKN